MVAFCHECSQSLPFADLVISDGKEEPAPGYECPHCHQTANPEAPSGDENEDGTEGEIGPGEFVIKDGSFLDSE